MIQFVRLSKGHIPITIVALLVIGNTVWHRFIPDNLLFLHNIYPLLYLFPVVLAGLYYGRIGGAVTAFAVAVLSIPHFMYLLHSDPAYLYKSFFEIVLYFVIGITIGHVADTMRKEQLEKQQLLDEFRITERGSTLSEIAHIISHELKTPLSSISGAVDLIAGDDATEDKKHYRDIIHKELSRMNNLISGTLRTFHENKIEKRPVTLATFFDEIRTLFSVMYASSSVTLEIALQTKIKTVRVAHELFREAFLNLIDTAADASQGDGSVLVVIRDDGEHIDFLVKDSGSGMDAAVLRNIFTPFYTTKSYGTGLGTTITKRIVELHGGSIACTSTPGKGTEFLIRIPLREIV